MHGIFNERLEWKLIRMKKLIRRVLLLGLKHACHVTEKLNVKQRKKLCSATCISIFDTLDRPKTIAAYNSDTRYNSLNLRPRTSIG